MSNGVVVLDEAQVSAMVDKLDAVATLRRMFLELAEGRAVQPPQTLTLFPDDAGDVINYSGVLGSERVFGVKMSPYIPSDGKALVTAWTLLMSMDTGQPLLLCDAKRLTTERTAGVTALAMDLLAPQVASKLAVIGSGPVAEAHIRHAMSLRDWSSVRVHSRNIAEAPPSVVDHLTGLDPRVAIIHALDEAVADADVIMLCTSSGTPVIDPARLGKPALITSISTNVARAHEVPPEQLSAMDIYCDYRATTPASAGEMVIATEQHGWSASVIKGDLPELCAGRVQAPDYRRHAFFRSIGLGLEDIAVASEIRRAHRALTKETV